MRIIRLLFFALILIQVTIASAFAATTVPTKINITLRDVIDTVEKSFSSDSRYDDNDMFIIDFIVDFFQRSTMAAQKREMKAEGELFLKNADYSRNEPLKFRFDYFRPTRHEIVTNGSTLWTYLPENRQVIQSDISMVFDPSISNPARTRAVNFLQGLSRISKDFQISFSTQGKDVAGNYILELTPRRSMDTIEKLFIVVRFESIRRYVQNGRHIINPAYKSNRRADLPQPELAFPILATTVIDHDGNSTSIEFSHAKVNNRLSNLLFVFDVPLDVQVVRPPSSR